MDRLEIVDAVIHALTQAGDESLKAMDYPPDYDIKNTDFVLGLCEDLIALHGEGLITQSLDGNFFLASVRGRAQFEEEPIPEDAESILLGAREQALREPVA